MPREANKLSAPKVSKLKTPGRYCDGLGLWLQVSQAGTKAWLFRYMRHGRARQIAAINFLQACNFPSGLIWPLRELIGVLSDAADAKQRKGKPGSPGMPHNEATDAIIAAVGVTVLSRKKDRSVSDALRLVSKSSGLDMDWLRHKLDR